MGLLNRILSRPIEADAVPGATYDAWPAERYEGDARPSTDTHMALPPQDEEPDPRQYLRDFITYAEEKLGHTPTEPLRDRLTSRGYKLREPHALLKAMASPDPEARDQVHMDPTVGGPSCVLLFCEVEEHDHSVRPTYPDTYEVGQGLAEYALVISLIAIVAIFALLYVGAEVSRVLSAIGTSV